MTNKLISILLVLASLFLFAVPVGAARGEEEFLSDVALIYRDSVDSARRAIEGTDWKLFETDLNPNADYMFDNGVYLIYKTSTNVEDAITDLRVMDMYGGYSASNYEQQLEKSRQEYLGMVSDIRAAATEFKRLYNAGDGMALLAYRQMNYYKDIGESDMLMGDFMLNIPSDDALVTVMMEGNSYVTFNLIALLAIGLSGASEATLATRIEEMYEIKSTLDDKTYYDDASALSEQFSALRSYLIRYDSLRSEYDLEDEEMSEEEFQFISEYGVIAEALAKIPYGNVSLKDFIVLGSWTLADLYPIIAALSDGQKALSSMGLFTTVLQYSSPSKPLAELVALVDEMEKEMLDEEGNIKLIDVYVGMDRSIFDGTFAFTTAAERQQALTGKEWSLSAKVEDLKAPLIASTTIFGLGALCFSTKYIALGIVKILKPLAMTAIKASAPNAVSNIAGTLCLRFHASFRGTTYIGGWTVGIGIGVMLIAAGIVGFMLWYGYYNPDYAPIPNVLVDVRETDLGDKYVKYTAAKVYGEGDKNADFNAYEGKEWNALYYTKDASAGNCLTPNFVCKDNDSTVARRHQGVSMFGEDKAFDLNSHVFNSSAPGVYLTVRYSTTKKAAADLPTVVGSIFSSGAYYALVGIGGIALGAGAMALITHSKKKSESESK